jgi:uncharacterized membrane protein YedE/YeeE
MPLAASPAPLQLGTLAAALVLGAALAAAVAAHGARMLVLAALGVALGATLYHAAFGFTAAYRRLLEGRCARGVRAQLLMLAAATALFAPLLAQGEWFGRELSGAVAPAGVQVAVGAFLFGIGMQLAGGCGSGALYAAGGGQLRMLVTLAAFCAGSFWASLHWAFWTGLPAPEAVALGEALGWPAATALQFAVLGGLYALARLVPDEAPQRAAPPGIERLARGPWPLAAGALLLAALNAATLLAAGHPWSITWAFTLWGAKIARALGWSPEGDPFWGAGFPWEQLEASVFADVTSVMDFGLVIGALAAAALAGRFRARLDPAPGALLAALLGGLAMGYGARIAFGCNIGAFFSGVASTSLHGWLWIAAALPGSWVGLKLRPLYGLR